MKFLADMNISPVTVTLLKEEGLEIERVSTILGKGVTDDTILLYAREHGYIIVTHDLDFSALLAIGGHEKPGVINLRLDNARPDQVASRLRQVIAELKDVLGSPIVVSVDEETIRYRTLPIE